MEASGEDLDLGGNGAAADPFDDVGGEKPLPEGVVPGTLGGENPSEGVVEPDPEPDPLEDAPPEADPLDPPPPAPEPEPDPEPTPDPEPEPETPVEESPSDPPEPPVDEPPTPAKAKPPKSKSSGRPYVILKEGDDAGSWVEAFDREDPEEPFAITARNTEAVLRKAYRMLSESEDEPQNYNLVPIPASHFRPTPVAGRTMKQTAISVG